MHSLKHLGWKGNFGEYFRSLKHPPPSTINKLIHEFTSDKIPDIRTFLGRNCLEDQETFYTLPTPLSSKNPPNPDTPVIDPEDTVMVEVTELNYSNLK